MQDLDSDAKFMSWFYAWNALEFLETRKAFFSTLLLCILLADWLFCTFGWQWRLGCSWSEFKSHTSGMRSHSAVDPMGQGLTQGSFHGCNLSRMRIGWKHLTEVAAALGRRWWSLTVPPQQSVVWNLYQLGVSDFLGVTVCIKTCLILQLNEMLVCFPVCCHSVFLLDSSI